MRRWALVLFALLAAVGAQAPPPTALATEVEAIAITVGDLERSAGFFTQVLAFEAGPVTEAAGDALEHATGVFASRTRAQRVRLGDEQLELVEYLAPRGDAFPADTKSNDRWFQHVAIIVSDMDAAYARLREHHVAHASSGPQTLPAWNQNAAGIRAFYFRDPDGHFLEILQFPPGKGEARWQRKDALFLGIDHTAIVVGDTEASLAFYRDVLGLRVVGGSENWGIEQERLNSVFGARLRITTLRAAHGPAIEFLEYLAPGTGRRSPSDLAPNDLAHFEVVVRCPDADAASARLRAARAQFVSPGVVEFEDRAVLRVRDADGHALRLQQTRAR